VGVTAGSAEPAGTAPSDARRRVTDGGVRDAARDVITRRADQLVELSHWVHAHPELCYEEHECAARVAGALSDGGMTVESGVGELPTAFVARAGSGPLTVAVCAEYDALPGIGHACGHNIIAAGAAGAGLALAEVADDAGLTVVVVGTPAEEGGGGKVHLLERGVFDGVHAAMMVHPWPTERLEATCLAVSHFDVSFLGKEAHASAAPWRGVNAADAMTLAQVAVGLLRQQLPPGDQVHGVVIRGGEAANIIPASTVARYMCRSLSVEGLRALEPRVRACFEAGAMAAGATVAFEERSPVYSHMESDRPLLGAYRANAEALGRHFDLDDLGAPRPTLSTDMANVSLVIPTIHPLIGIDGGGSVNHQPEFAAACVTPSADAAVIDGALAMAWTCIDAARHDTLRQHLLAGPP
jgi:amidohydrolase